MNNTLLITLAIGAVFIACGIGYGVIKARSRKVKEVPDEIYPLF